MLQSRIKVIATVAGLASLVVAGSQAAPFFEGSSKIEWCGDVRGLGGW
jgi:hypothetical protein